MEERGAYATTLLLHLGKAIAIVPASSLPIEYRQPILDAIPVMSRWVRAALLAMALGLVSVFGIAAWLNPYDEAGQARRMETHLQLGLPPCAFRFITGVPCPSCGMTTSFALLIRGDVRNSLQANAVGTLLALFCFVVIGWSIVSVVGGRYFLIVSIERALTWIVIVFMVLVLLRWFIVLGMAWWTATKM